MSLPFADSQFLLVAQCKPPALAAQSYHLSDVVDVDDGISVNPLELGTTELGFDAAKRLRGNQVVRGRYDPDQCSFGLEGQHFVRVEQEVLIPSTTDNFTALPGTATCMQGGNLCHCFSNLRRLVLEMFGLFDCLPQPECAYWFEEIIDCAGIECLNRMLIECRHDHNGWQPGTSQIPDDLESSHNGHLQVQEDQVGVQVVDLFQGFPAVSGLADDLYLAENL